MAGETSKVVDLTGKMVLDPVPLADWLVVAPVAIPIVAGAVFLMLRHETKLHGWLALIALTATLAANIGLLARILENGPVVMTMGRWLPPFGISFTADTLGASMSLVATLVAAACGIYSIIDIGSVGRRYGFYAFMLMMMAGVNGAFLTGDIFNLYVWFEVFLISSFGLLVLGSEHRQLDGATKYAILNLVGTMLFLTATAFVYGIFGTLNMADIARSVDGARDTAPLMTLSVLYLLAFGMKAAAFPVNFWLPASYHTPRLVTAALFGGVLTKVGIYALLRVMVMLFPPELERLSVLVAWVAGATMILGTIGALAQTDLRRLLGFIVISGVGVMLAGLALGSAEGLSGTIFYAFHSMVAMTALYLLAGMMKGLGGSYSLAKLGGLYVGYPLLAAMALILILAAAGLPPASGLWPKVMLVRASLDAGAPWLAFAILATGFLTTLALGRVFILTIWRPSPAGDMPEVEPYPTGRAYLALGVLILPILVMGLYPDPFIKVAGEATAGILDASGYIQSVFPQGGGE